MYKPGEELICINKHTYISDLTIGKKYKVYKVILELDTTSYMILIDDNSESIFEEGSVYHGFFVSKSEYRKKKLEKYV